MNLTEEEKVKIEEEEKYRVEARKKAEKIPLHKQPIGCAGSILIIIIIIVMISIFSKGSKQIQVSTVPAEQPNKLSTELSSVTPVNAKPSIQKITLTESQCQKLKSEFYSLILQEPFNKTQLGKELLEQYASDAGISVKKDNPNVRYILPESECGQYLDTALDAIILGEKNNGGL